MNCPFCHAKTYRKVHTCANGNELWFCADCKKWREEAPAVQRITVSDADIGFIAEFLDLIPRKTDHR